MFLILQETNQPGRLPSDTYFQSRGCVCHHYLLLSLTFVSFLRSHLLDMERGGFLQERKILTFSKDFSRNRCLFISWKVPVWQFVQYGTRLIRDHIWVPQWIFIGIRLCLDYTCSSEILTPATYKSRIVGQKSDSLKQYKWKLVFKTWRTFSPLKSLTRWVAHLMHLVHCFIR